MLEIYALLHLLTGVGPACVFPPCGVAGHHRNAAEVGRVVSHAQCDAFVGPSNHYETHSVSITF